MNITAEYECCYNTFVAEFYGRRYEIMQLTFHMLSILIFTVLIFLIKLYMLF